MGLDIPAGVNGDGAATPAPPQFTGQEEPTPDAVKTALMSEIEQLNGTKMWLLAQRLDYLRRINELEIENAALREQVTALSPRDPGRAPGQAADDAVLATSVAERSEVGRTAE